MSKVSLRDAKTNLSKLIQDALNGKEVIISSKDKLLVRLVPVETKASKSLLGLFQGQIWMSKDFNSSLDDFQDYQQLHKT